MSKRDIGAAFDRVQYRAVSIRAGSLNASDRTVSLAFSSDAPIMREFFGDTFHEVLSHEPGAVRLGRLNDGGALLLDHDVERQVGAVETAQATGGKGRAKVRLSRNAAGAELLRDIEDGIKTKISVGYRVHNHELIEGTGAEPDEIRVTDWEPLEISFVAVPADASVGVGRSTEFGVTRMDNEETEKKLSRSERRRTTRETLERSAATEEIRLIGEKFGEPELAREILELGGSEDDLCKQILAKRNNATPLPHSSAPVARDAWGLPRGTDFGKRHSPIRSDLLRRAYGDDGHEAQESAYRAGQWVRGFMLGDDSAKRWCQSYGVRALGENVFTKGGATVPDELSSSIINLQEEHGVARQETEMMPMNSDTIAVPRRTGGATAYYIDENSSLTESEPTFDTVTLVARKLAALTRVSTELAEDSVIDLALYLADEFGRRFAEAEDEALFNGDGTSTYGGIVGVRPKLVDGDHAAGAIDATSATNTLPEIAAADLTTVMAALPAYALQGAKWYCSQAANQLVFQSIAQSAGGQTMIERGNAVIQAYMGYPIVVSQVLPASSTTDYENVAMLLFGDLRQAAMMGVRRDIRIRVLEERYADLDQLGVQGTERFDVVVHALGDATTAGPIVGLIGN